ncbi:MAG TPA: hypothetical protein VH684_15415 [Xanthobacteraceae bacterium]|jgi:hypothetical protein
MRNQKIRFCLLILGAAAVANVPEPTLTFAAANKNTSHETKQKITFNEAKEKCTENAKSAAPGAGHLSVEARQTVYARCMRRAGFYNER